MGQILLPQGQGPFLGPHTERWSKAAAVTPRKCSPHPPHQQHTLPVGQAQRHQPADRHLPAAPCCSHHPPLGHIEGVQVCPAVTQCRVALTLV